MAQATPQYPSASLYVGDLHRDVTEAFLYEIFKEAGNIISIRICRDVLSRESLGYAYVNFQNPQDADRALDQLNFTVINDKPIRIMWSQRDPTLRKSGVGNVFIKNLDKAIDNKALHDTFAAFGRILSCKVQHKPNRDTGVGYVHFQEKDDANESIAKLNGMLMNGQKVTVEHYTRKPRTRIDDTNFTNCYVKNIDKSITDEALTEMFSQFGEVQHAAVMKHRTTGESRGFGFCNFVEHDPAAKACAHFNGSTEEAVAAPTKTIVCCRAMSKPERQRYLRDQFQRDPSRLRLRNPGTNLYVKHLEETTSDDELRAMFAPFGEITSAVVMRDEQTGLSKGFGFVNFKTEEEASVAITEMNDKLIGQKPLYVSLAQPKSVRRQQMLHRFGPRGMPMPSPGAAQGYPGPMGSPQQQQQQWYPQGMPMGPMGRPPMGQPHRGGPGPRGMGPTPQGAWGQPHPHHPGYRGPGPQEQRGYAFKQTARNVGGPQGGQQAPGPQGEAPHLPGMMEPAETLPGQGGKGDIGEQLFPIVIDCCGGDADKAGKVTGMLLEMEGSELAALIGAPRDTVIAQVGDAIRFLDSQEQALALQEAERIAAEQAAPAQQ